MLTRALGVSIALTMLAFTMSGESAFALEAKRVALVVGIDSYVRFDADHQLKKAVNDAMAVGDALERDGFTVIRGTDLTRSAMVDKLYDLASRIEAGDTAFVFFAGHGVALGSGNYLLPSDVPEAGAGQEARIASQSLAEADIVATLKDKGARIAIVVIDACRDNPFKKPGVRSAGLERGLARAPEVTGVFSLYSAGFGQSALDRLSDDDPNPNSVFTRVLVPLLTKRGLNLDDLAYEVRERVAKLAASVPGDHEQVPAAYNQILGGRVYLAGPPEEATGSQVGAATAVEARADEIAWSFVAPTIDPSQIEAFMARFPGSPLRPQAAARLAALRATQVASLPKPADERTLAVVPSGAGDGKPPQAAIAPDGAARECDRLAADPADTSRPAGIAGLPFEAIDPGRAVPACRSASLARPADARIAFELGRAVQRDGKAGEAAGLYRKAADMGSSAGMTSLGVLYEFGRGVTEDKSEAVRWYRKAADAGDPRGMVNLGNMLKAGIGVQKDVAQAVSWYRRAADGGDARGMTSLGIMYEFGDGVARDPAAAVDWYRKGAEAGDARGMVNFGNMLNNGVGIAKDVVEAANWFRKGAEAGQVRGMMNLAIDYDFGVGVGQDAAMAATWYRKAADAGYAPAMTSLGFHYEFGKGVPKDAAEAVGWYRRAANAGDGRGMTNLGNMYKFGNGVETDVAEAARWFRKGADAGETRAMTNLAYDLEHGVGVTTDVSEAARWYRQAADAGNALGMDRLARLYEHGIGVARDDREALRWYRRAANAGFADALPNIDRLQGPPSLGSVERPRR